jgi:hypothetical protein
MLEGKTCSLRRAFTSGQEPSYVRKNSQMASFAKNNMPNTTWKSYESYASLLIRATDQRRSKKLFGLRSTSARFQRKCFFPLSANLRKIQVMREKETALFINDAAS